MCNKHHSLIVNAIMLNHSKITFFLYEMFAVSFISKRNLYLKVSELNVLNNIRIDRMTNILTLFYWAIILASECIPLINMMALSKGGKVHNSNDP